MAKNRYTRALKVLKNSQVDEKIQMLESLPTNNTTGLYVVDPAIINTVTIQGLERAADFTQDGDGGEDYDGTDTSGLFLSDGTILTIEPPGDTSYILGPMASMWYAWGNFTQIGYIRQSDRKMVNLARITGQLGSWDGESNFTSYGQLTLEQAVFFQNTPKLNGADNDTPNYRAFYPGPPSNVADEHGRYLCVITGTPKETSREETQRTPDVMGDAESQGYPWEKKRASDEDKDDELMQTILNATMLGLDIVAVLAVLFPEPTSSAAGAAHLASKLRYAGRLMRAVNRLNPFRAKPKYRPTRARYGDGASKPTSKPKDPMDQVLRDIDAAGRRLQQQPRGTNPRGAEVRGPYSDVKAQSRPGSGKYRSQSRNYDPKNNPSFGSRRGTRRFNDSFDYELYAKALQCINENAPATSIPGGTAAADGYVDEISKTSSPDELEKASNDANSIASEGGKGLSDSDLKKIDKDAEAEAKRLTNVNINDPESMTDEQLYASIEALNDIDPDWLESTMKKLEPLIPQDKIDDLIKEYEDKFNEKVANKESIEDAIKELDKNYRDLGRGYDTRYGWGGQFTKQMFESSGQSFEKYDELRGQIGFFNNDSGPNKYGQYYTLGYQKIMYAKENGHTPEQFTGVAREIVERSYRLDEIKSNRNYPRPGRNLYYNEADYQEAKSLEKEYQSVFEEYIQLWEGPGGYEDLSNKAWNFYEVSENAKKKDVADAQKRRDALQSDLDAIETGKKYDDEFYRKIDKLYRPYNIAIINEWDGQLFGSDYSDLMPDPTSDPMNNDDLRYNDPYSTDQPVPMDLMGDLALLGISYVIAQRLISTLGVAKVFTLTKTARNLKRLKDWWNKGRDGTVPGENTASWKDLKADDLAQGAKFVKKGSRHKNPRDLTNADFEGGALPRNLDQLGQLLRGKGGFTWEFNPFPGGGLRTGPTALTRQLIERPFRTIMKFFESSNLKGNLITEETSDQKALYDILDAALKETDPKDFGKVIGKFLAMIDDQISKRKAMESYQPKFLEHRDRQPLEEVITPKQKRILREIKKPFEIKEAPTKFKVKPTGRNNKVVGAELMKPIENQKAFKPDPAIWKAGHKKYNEISSQDKKNHVLELVGASEHHWSTLIERSDRERQEKVNEAMAQEFDREMEKLYEKYQEKETKVDKVIQAIKTTSLDKSKIKPVHPDEPPSQRVNGYHPKYGQKYKHDKLDPHSAEFMPDTGNPVIDANIRKSTDQEKKNRKVRILRKPSGMS